MAGSCARSRGDVPARAGASPARRGPDNEDLRIVLVGSQVVRDRRCRWNPVSPREWTGHVSSPHAGEAHKPSVMPLGVRSLRWQTTTTRPPAVRPRGRAQRHALRTRRPKKRSNLSQRIVFPDGAFRTAGVLGSRRAQRCACMSAALCACRARAFAAPLRLPTSVAAAASNSCKLSQGHN